MSSRVTSKKIKNSWEDFGNGQDVINSGRQITSEKSKVDFIYEAVPCRSKHDIILVLQSCDYNVDAAISIFSQGKADEILNQWSHKGKKNKNVNKKKQNKKKHQTIETIGNVPLETKDVSQAFKDSDVVNEQPSSLVKGLSLDLPVSLSSESVVGNGISSTSDQSVHSSVMSSKKPSQHAKHHHFSSHHPKHTNDHTKHVTEKLSPTSRSDALKKSTKDLQRSSFSLARYQLVLEEECEQSLKSITKTFESIRKCINEREQFLTQSLKEFKEEADKLLQQRLEDASALKLKTERVHSMPEEQVSLLRADIKSFVAERKLDEELAQTKRFICDEEKMIQDMKTFGQVVPIKGTYTPVVLNHILPATTSKTASNRTSSQTTNLTITKSSRQPLLLTSSPTSSGLAKAISTDKPSAAPHKNVDSQSFSSLDAKANAQPSTVAATSQAQTVNKSKNLPQHTSTESHHKSSAIESQHESSSVELQHKSLSVESHQKVSNKKARDPKTTLESNKKAVSHQAERKEKRASHAASTETKSKERNVPSSKSIPKQQVKDLTHASIDISSAKFSGPPPKISTLISLAMAKSSAVVSEGSQDIESKHQETARDAEQKRDGRNHSKDQNRGQRNRPNIASEHQGKPQRNRESSSNRPLSTRQRRDKEKDNNPVSSVNGQEKTSEEKQSEQPQESRRRRQRRRGRDRKSKEGEVTPGNQDKDSQSNRYTEKQTKIENEKGNKDKDNAEKSHQSTADKEDPKEEDTSSSAHIPIIDKEELHVLKEENVVSQTENVSTVENDKEKESNLELPVQFTHDNTTTSQTESIDQEINKDEQPEKSKDICPSPKRNGVHGHADDLVDETTEEKNNDHTQATDGALPQRSQHSRRNRGQSKKNDSNTIVGYNGSTNGVCYETTDGDEESSERSQEALEESVNGKLSLAPALINGQCNESAELDKHKESISETQDNEASTNSTADDCLVER